MSVLEQQQRSKALHRQVTELEGGTNSAIREARRRLFDLQFNDGHWCAELEGDSILESEYVLLMLFLGGYEEKIRKAANYIRDKQLEEGGWAIYPGGPADISASVKAYFVLKLVGDSPEEPHMVRAQQVIRRLGGLDACNSFTKLYLSIFGLYEWERSPGVPPELILFPNWFPFNIYEMSSWSRAIVVPLSVIWASKPSCQIPEHASIEELRIVDSRVAGPRFSRGSLAHHGWSLFFQVVDRAHKLLEHIGFLPLRPRALRRAEQWILQRLDNSDGLGAIFPPIVNTIIALRCLGYSLDHEIIRSQIHELEKLELEDGDKLRIQPCKSPCWDTALSIHALGEQDEPEVRPRLAEAVRWLLDHEVREVGDWHVRSPQAPIGGWYFEYNNEFYPDVDDTAQILTAVSKLPRTGSELAKRWEAASQRAIGWMLSMQNRDGGWASFDQGCDKEFLTYIPFADHNAMIDPSTSDITARVIEALARHGYDHSSSAVRRGIEYLFRMQEADGSWYGRWGCNYLYGTYLALVALEAIGEDMTQEPIRRAADWLRQVQNPDGGWGELPESYADPTKKGVGPSTAAQTAWAVIALIAAGEAESPDVARGIAYLLDSQLSDGGWDDELWTGTGFPEVFYLKYHLYATYFPLLALEIWRRSPSVHEPGALADGPHPIE